MAMWNLSGLWSEDKEGWGGVGWAVSRDLAAIQAIPRLAITVKLLHPSIDRWPLICANVLTVNWALTCVCTVWHAVQAPASISLIVVATASQGAGHERAHEQTQSLDLTGGRSSPNKGKHTFVSGHTMKVTQQIKLGIEGCWISRGGMERCFWKEELLLSLLESPF